MSLKRHLVVASTLLFVATIGQTAQAAPIIGTLNGSGFDLELEGVDLTAGIVTGLVLTGATSGDFDGIPPGTIFDDFGLDTGNIVGTFTFSHLSFGSFVPASVVVSTQTPTLLILSLLGTFNPGPGLGGFAPTPAKIELTVSSSGGEGGGLEANIVLTSQAPAVPEPGAWSMLVVGGLGLARYRRRLSR